MWGGQTTGVEPQAAPGKHVSKQPTAAEFYELVVGDIDIEIALLFRELSAHRACQLGLAEQDMHTGLPHELMVPRPESQEFIQPLRL